MKSIPSLDGQYPVRTVFTDCADGQRHADWQRAEVRADAFRQYLGVPLERVFYAYEKDAGDVLDITVACADTMQYTKKEDIYQRFGGFDAMVTAIPSTMLCVCAADCLPLFLYDPDRNVAGIAHCGWRGICAGIVSNIVGVMTRHYGVDARHVIAAFGPCICGRCYEVGGELRDAFAERFTPSELPSLFTPKEDGKYLLDLRESVRLELLRAGVNPAQIHDTGICTYERKEYPSCRRSGAHVEVRHQIFSGIVLVKRETSEFR